MHRNNAVLSKHQMRNLFSRAQAVLLFCLLSLTGEGQISYLLYMNFEKTTFEAYKTPLHGI